MKPTVFSPVSTSSVNAAKPNVAVKANDTNAIRGELKTRRKKPVIPSKSNRTATIRYDKTTLSHVQLNRARDRPPQNTIAPSRPDMISSLTSFLGMLYLAAARYWIKSVHAA